MISDARASRCGRPVFRRKIMENFTEGHVLEGVSGLNFSVSGEYIDRRRHFSLKDSLCSCTKIGNFYMLYVNQPAISPEMPLVDSVVGLLAKLFHFGLLSFREGFRLDCTGLDSWIRGNLASILRISELSLFWDYPEAAVRPVPRMSRLETTLLRHGSVWAVYDKRGYISGSGCGNRDYGILTHNPIRMEFHITLKNCAFLSLSVLRQTVPGLLASLAAYTQKSHRRWKHIGLPPLPAKYDLPDRIPHAALPKPTF